MKVRINFHCRHYQEMDAEDVLAIEHRCHGADGLDADDLAFLYAHPSDYVLRIAECGGVLFGFCSWNIQKNRAQVLRVSVDPRFRRMGVGSALIEPLNFGIQTEIFKYAFAPVPEELTEAHCFFRSQGYQCRKIESDHLFGNGGLAYRFIKTKHRLKIPIRFGKNRIAQFYDPSPVRRISQHHAKED